MISHVDVQQAKEDLMESLGRLDERLDQAGPNGDDWRKFLRWDALQEELQGDKPADKALLTRIYQRYAAAEEGLELVWFLDVQRDLRNYIATLNAVDNPQVRVAYEALLDKLADNLESYLAKPTTDAALVISESVRWLDDAGQAPRLIDSIERRFVRPNLMLEVASDVVGVGIAESFDDTTPVNDCILGTTICGTAHTVGETSVVTSPSRQCGVLDTLFFGKAVSESVGYHGPVTVFSTSTTCLAARKRLLIDANGISACPSVANADTSICVQDIQSNKGRQFIERAAWKRADKQQSQAECVASRHAEAQLNQRIDAHAAESIEKANRSYVNKFQKPFQERKLFPQSLCFSTTDRVLRVTALQAGDGKFGAPGAPPAVVAGADMSLRVHESMINNLALDALGERTVHEEKLQASVKDLLGHLPEKMKGDDDGQPWAITFARRQPISVTFADNGFRITIRGVKYYKGGEGHPGMNVSACYKIEHSAEGFVAVRQGAIEVFPPDFVPGSGQQIDARRQVIRKLLEKRFAKVFEPRILGEGLELPGKWKAAGKMIPIQVESHDGWLVIAWKRAAAAPKVAASQ